MGVGILTVPFDTNTNTFAQEPLKAFLIGKSIVSLTSHCFQAEKRTFAALVVHYRIPSELIEGIEKDVNELAPEKKDAQNRPAPAATKKTAGSATAGKPTNGEAAAKKIPAYQPENLNVIQARLFEKMRRWRYKRATEMTVPAYQICSNRELENLILQMPDSIEQIQNTGVMKGVKFEAHGAQILAALHRLAKEN